MERSDLVRLPINGRGLVERKGWASILLRSLAEMLIFLTDVPDVPKVALSIGSVFLVPFVRRPTLHSTSNGAPVDVNSDTVSKVPGYSSVPFVMGM